MGQEIKSIYSMGNLRSIIQQSMGMYSKLEKAETDKGPRNKGVCYLTDVIQELHKELEDIDKNLTPENMNEHAPRIYFIESKFNKAQQYI